MDMGDYGEKHWVDRLVGAPPGYVGYEEGGQLTEAVRRRPYCVILLDEVEKAHPDVFNVLLQILDDGRLTDGQGRTVDFRNTILVMTSNLGSAVIADPALSERERRDAVMAVVQRHFKPEFLNRLDDVVVFSQLTMAELTSIADIQVERLSRRLAARRLTLKISDAAREWLALNGFDPETNRRLGFAHQVTDPEREDQFLGVGREFPIAEDPSRIQSIAKLSYHVSPETYVNPIRDLEANAVADLCASLVGNVWVRRSSGDIARAEPGDIPLLAPRRTQLWRYERAAVPGLIVRPTDVQ